MNKYIIFARNRSKCLSGGNVTFGTGRTNGRRIHDQRVYGIDPNIVSTPYSYDNDDVPEFAVDPNCDYSAEPRRNIVRSGYKGSEPTPEPTPGPTPGATPEPTNV